MDHILVVDDNKVNLVSAKTVLSGKYKVTCVTLGSQALKFLEKNKVDLILLDKNMPEMDGLDVMAAIRSNESTKDIPIVFITADGDAGTETRCIEEGAQDFISKPFVPSVMLSRIDRIIELTKLRNDLKERLEAKTIEADDALTKSRQDVLTGLFHREYAEKVINEILANGIGGSFFMIDLDNFKLVNDKYGHQMGDKVLVTYADILKDVTTESDVLCRIGGDEYVAFISGIVNKDHIGKMAAEIISRLAKKLDEYQIDTNSSVSIGISQAPDNGTDFETLYHKADNALYLVKQNGKNSFHFYSDTSGEITKSDKLVTLAYIKELIEREDSIKGSYLLDFNNFRHIYNFLKRYAERNESNVLTVLFSLDGSDDVTEEEYTTAIESLNEAIYNSLRRVDVSSMYSTRQDVVILMEAKPDSGDAIAARVIAEFDKLNANKKISVRYEVVKLED